MGMKGQIEIIFLVGLVIISIIAAYLFLASPSGDNEIDNSGLTDETKTIKDSISNLMRTGLIENIDLVYMQGGVLNPSDDSVKVGIYDVEILYDNGESKNFTFTEDLRLALGKYIEDNIEPEMDFYGKEVIFDMKSLDIKIFLRKGYIGADVNLPTKVEGVDIAQPYKISVPSDLFDIEDTAKKIIMKQNETRFLEMNLLDMIYRIDASSDYHVPLNDILTGCENIFFTNRQDVLDSLESMLRYSASHTILDDENAGEGFYGLDISSDVDTVFMYPVWNLTEYFSVVPDPAVSVPSSLLSLSSFCVSGYNLSYTFRYPFVIYMRDEPLGKWFRFVMMSNIDKNMPSDNMPDSFESSEDNAYYDDCEKMAKCPVKIGVFDSSSFPIEDAVVLFDDCRIGFTNVNGIVQGYAPCYAGELTIRKDGYELFNNFVRSDDLNGVKATLKKSDSISVDIYAIPIKPLNLMATLTGEYESYLALSDPVSLDDFPGRYVVQSYIYPISGGLVKRNYLLHNVKGERFVDHMETEFIPAGKYQVVASAMDNETGIISGYINTTFTSTGKESKFYLYIPIIAESYPEYEKRTISIYPNEIIKMTESITSIGVEPFSDKRQYLRWG